MDADRLVAGCLENSPGAWEEFIRRYGNLIYSTLMRLGLDPDAREESFQSAAVAIYRSMPRLRDSGRLVPWIIRIAYRQGVDQIRSRTRSKETPLDALTESSLHREAMPLGDEADPPDELRVRLERAQLAAEILEGLGERCRRLLTMLFCERPAPAYGEIARREGIPPGSIGPTRARCLEKARHLAAGWGRLG